MAITLSLSAANAAVNAIVDLIDTGTANANGDLILETSGGVEVATLELSNPAFGNAASRVATSNTVTSDTNATGGTVAQFKIRNRDNAAVISGSVTATGGGGDIELTSTTIPAGGTVTASSLTINGPS